MGKGAKDGTKHHQQPILSRTSLHTRKSQITLRHISVQGVRGERGGSIQQFRAHLKTTAVNRKVHPGASSV